MLPQIKLRVLLLLLVLMGALRTTAGADPQSDRPVKAVRLLTIGNSFSQNATRFLNDLAKAGGHQLTHRPIVVGGASLELHATKFQNHERDPNDANGRYSNGQSLKQMLLADRWDIVTIQQASIKSHDVETYRPFAMQIRNYIQDHAPQARLLVHETWAYRSDDPRFTNKSKEESEPPTQLAMYRGLKSAYGIIAQELRADLIPVGDAFFLAESDAKWGYRADSEFNFQAAKPTSLPNQMHSLHVGWRWQKSGNDAQRLSMDGHHASVAGEYLGGCVWYEVLFGESCIGNSFVPAGIETKYATFLQQTAHLAVTGQAK
jgi:hypothetical protein